jgi:hypothetical protein
VLHDPSHHPQPITTWEIKLQPAEREVLRTWHPWAREWETTSRCLWPPSSSDPAADHPAGRTGVSP